MSLILRALQKARQEQSREEVFSGGGAFSGPAPESVGFFRGVVPGYLVWIAPLAVVLALAAGYGLRVVADSGTSPGAGQLLPAFAATALPETSMTTAQTAPTDASGPAAIGEGDPSEAASVAVEPVSSVETEAAPVTSPTPTATAEPPPPPTTTPRPPVATRAPPPPEVRTDSGVQISRHLRRAEQARQANRLGEALEHYRAVLALVPEHPAAHCNAGEVLQELGRITEAEQHYRAALAANPALPAALNNLGIVLLARSRYDEAIECFRQALDHEPGRPEIYNSLGIALRRAGRADEAAGAYVRALRLDRHFAEAHLNLGILLEEQGELAEALAAYENFLRTAGQHHADHLPRVRQRVTALAASLSRSIKTEGEAP
jgi:Tfp pilus assembly protein PilF